MCVVRLTGTLRSSFLITNAEIKITGKILGKKWWLHGHIFIDYVGSSVCGLKSDRNGNKHGRGGDIFY